MFKEICKMNIKSLRIFWQFKTSVQNGCTKTVPRASSGDLLLNEKQSNLLFW